ncbi:Protein of unknown function (DUF4148) [Paraburkholderia caribensis MBA4]|uniref:DUF4148 domain-containing protein n=1 Tax=Paraburkholderia caribensis MBA4 TaxID=1323664 RepID=A0A0N7JVE9_9BURK|nr:DUF4148 domain-containing protein [Paraburkholderia caribensis]ALL69021.1 Protein of unknown function (DUF4148) [Paraburkholderia caribensis MBA4]
MKRNLLAGLALSLLVSAPAFAGGGGGIGRAGSYNDQWWQHSADASAPKSRAEVRAELNDAYRDGTLPSLNKTSYPEQGLIGRTQAERLEVQSDRSVRLARGQ